MAGAFTTLTILDGAGTQRTMRAWDESGAGTGPYSFAGYASDGAGSGGELALQSGLTTINTTLGTLSVNQAGTWNIASASITNSPSVSAIQSGTWNITSASIANSPSVSAIQSGSWNIASASIANSPTVSAVQSGTWNIASATVTQTSKNYLWFAGTSNNGLLETAVEVISTDLNSLGSGSVTQSQSGTFTNSLTSQAVWAEMFYFAGNPGLASVGAGANLAGWFQSSPDASIFETQPNLAVAPPRPPDFIIPLPALTVSASTLWKSAGLVRVPALNFKVTIQNNSGVTLSSGTTTAAYIKLAPIAVQY